MQTVLEQGSIDKPLAFDVWFDTTQFRTSLITSISVKLRRGFALQCFSLLLVTVVGNNVASVWGPLLEQGTETGHF